MINADSLGEAHPRLVQTMKQAVGIIRPNFHVGLDLFLALIPFVIALIIFRRNQKLRTVVWWPLLGIFVLFLPNAPYVLTDVIHFVAKVRVTPPPPIWAMSILLFEYFVYLYIGMQSFTLSLMLWGRALKSQHRGWLVFPLELLILTLSAFGIYMGRMDRLNSWDLVTEPERLMIFSLKDALSPRPEEMTVIFFVVVTVVFYLLKGANCVTAHLLRQQAPADVETAKK